MKKGFINESSLRKVIFQEMKSFLEKKPILDEMEKVNKELTLINRLDSLEKEISLINECPIFNSMGDEEVDIDEVISEPGTNKPIFQVKGSSLIEDDMPSEEPTDDAKWNDFEAALNEMGTSIKEDYKGEEDSEDDDDDDVHVEVDDEGNINFGEPLPSGKSTFKKLSDMGGDYSGMYHDLSEKMKPSDAEEIVESVKKKESKDKALKEAFERMKRLI